jgi:allophanate hydrolase
MPLPLMLSLPPLQAAFAAGMTLLDQVEDVIRRRDALADRAVFISATPDEALRKAPGAVMGGPRDLPLWGIPFQVKGNIDVVGPPTAAACPVFVYRPDADTTVVAHFRAAKAIMVGKANLDRFVTGLNGTRSPYG